MQDDITRFSTVLSNDYTNTVIDSEETETKRVQEVATLIVDNILVKALKVIADTLDTKTSIENDGVKEIQVFKSLTNAEDDFDGVTTVGYSVRVNLSIVPTAFSIYTEDVWEKATIKALETVNKTTVPLGIKLCTEKYNPYITQPIRINGDGTSEVAVCIHLDVTE